MLSFFRLFFKRKRLSTNELGILGEKIARKFLEKQGYKFVTKNWRVKSGELDLIMREGELFVFVEVKTRYEVENIEEMLFANITPNKLHRLQQLSSQYMIQHFGRISTYDYRIDAVGVSINQENLKPQVFHRKCL